jgi:hypothetical protein
MPAVECEYEVEVEMPAVECEYEVEEVEYENSMPTVEVEYEVEVEIPAFGVEYENSMPTVEVEYEVEVEIPAFGLELPAVEVEYQVEYEVSVPQVEIEYQIELPAPEYEFTYDAYATPETRFEFIPSTQQQTQQSNFDIPWSGWFSQNHNRTAMTLQHLHIDLNGNITGQGSDPLGQFTITGSDRGSTVSFSSKNPIK